ncbi:MAG: hypothetical protein II861_04670 [Methanomicrobium sp.]|nr:hypothetical protein [Methanomicrobium sp.]
MADDAAENFRNNPNPSGRGCNTGRDYPESRGKTGRSKAVKNGIPSKNGKKDNGGNSGNNGKSGNSGKSGNMPRSKSRRRTGKPKQENRGSHERQEGAPVSAQAGAAAAGAGAGAGTSPKVWGKAKKHVEGNGNAVNNGHSASSVNSGNSGGMPKHHGHHSKPRSAGRTKAYAARS